MRATLVLTAFVLALSACGKSSTENAQKELCKTAIMSFLRAHAMMSDDQGRIVQLDATETETMKDIIRTGLTAASSVTDSYLSSVQPELPNEFRNHLLKGWQMYLDGLDESNPLLQVKGIQLFQKWEVYKSKHIDHLYHTIIE